MRYEAIEPIKPEGTPNSVWLGLLAIRGIGTPLSQPEIEGVKLFMGFSGAVRIRTHSVDPQTNAVEIQVSTKGRKDFAATTMVNSLREGVAGMGLLERTNFLGLSIVEAHIAVDNPFALYDPKHRFDDTARFLYEHPDTAQAA